MTAGGRRRRQADGHFFYLRAFDQICSLSLPKCENQQGKKQYLRTTSTLPFLGNHTENVAATAACKHFLQPAVARDIFLWEMGLLLDAEDLKGIDPSSPPPAPRRRDLRKAL